MSLQNHEKLNENTNDMDNFRYYESLSMAHGSLMNIMGTRFDFLTTDKNLSDSNVIWNRIVLELKRLNEMLNRYDIRSEISSINSKAFYEPVQVSQEMWSILKSCQNYHILTLGLFDITLNDFSKVLFDEEKCSVIFSENGISLDFGGYAKGYALAKIKDIIHQVGIKDCFVDFGNSSILGIGHHPYGDAWMVSVENPFNRDEILAEISLKDLALSVSGNTPTYTGHIIRPDTKKPISERKIVSITSVDPLDAEVLSTVFMVANDSEKERIKENFKVQDITEY